MAPGVSRCTGRGSSHPAGPGPGPGPGPAGPAGSPPNPSLEQSVFTLSSGPTGARTSVGLHTSGSGVRPRPPLGPPLRGSLRAAARRDPPPPRSSTHTHRPRSYWTSAGRLGFLLARQRTGAVRGRSQPGRAARGCSCSIKVQQRARSEAFHPEPPGISCSSNTDHSRQVYSRFSFIEHLKVKKFLNDVYLGSVSPTSSLKENHI